VGEQRVGNGFQAGTAVGHGAAEIDGIPEDHGGHHQVESGSPILLVFERPVADFALPMKEQRPRQGVTGLALVQAGIRAAA
jgi:hypothetical protein